MKITLMVAMATQRPKLKHTVNIHSQSTWQKLLKSCSAKICDGHESLRIFLSCHNMLLRLLFLLERYRKVHPKLKAEVNYFLQNIINPMSSLTARSFYHKHDRERHIMIYFPRFSTIVSKYS